MAWVAHIVIYLLINPPLSPFLNEVFIKLDSLWGNLDYILFLPNITFSFYTMNAILIYLLYYLIRSSGYRSICILLLLSSACSDCWSNDAWSQTYFHYNSPHEVMDFVELAFFFFFFFSLSADTSVIAHQLNSSVHRWGATLMNSFLFNVGLILLCSIRLASLVLCISHLHNYFYCTSS